MAVNTKKYIEQYLQIRTKNAEIVPLRLNAPQKKLYDALAAQAKAGKPLRAIVLKARQMGFSTLTEALIFKRTATRRAVRSGIVAHRDDSSNNLFNMSKRFYDNLPPALQPQCKASNARELVFDMPGRPGRTGRAGGTGQSGDPNRTGRAGRAGEPDRPGDAGQTGGAGETGKENWIGGAGLGSSIKVMTAGGPGIGRSETFQNLHLSEYAFWPGDKEATLAGLLNAVPDAPDTMVVIESTANGFDAFKRRWDDAVAGKSGFVPVFCAWWELEEYRRTPEPGFARTAAEEALAGLYGLDDAQLAWRRSCIQDVCGGDVELFHQEYPSCPEEAFLSTGTCIFDKTALTARLAAPPAAVRRVRFAYTERGGVLTLTGVEDDPRGPVLVYRAPEPGKPYVIGGDTAGDGSDWFTGQVLDNTTGGQAAVLRQRFDEDEYARQMMCLGYWYNTALLGIEVNFSTFPVKECTRLGYPRQYQREVQDSYTGRLQQRFGFRTDQKSRPAAIAQLVRYAREHPEGLCDAETLREMLVFVKNERGRSEAMRGEHDDLVMALAIAHACRGQQSFLLQAEEDSAAEWPEWDEDGAQDEALGEFLAFGG